MPTNIAVWGAINGARVSAVSSNFGAGSDSSMFGATRAIDGDSACALARRARRDARVR